MGSAERRTPGEFPAGDHGTTSGEVGTDVLEPGPDGTTGSRRSAGPWPSAGPATPPVASPPPVRPVRWRLPLAYVVASALLVTGVLVAVDTHARLHRTDTELTAVRAQLRHTIGRAHRAEAALATVTSQSATAAAALATETTQLGAAEAQWESTEVNVFANGVSINDLDTCLAGVEQALNQISLNDQTGAAVTLDGVAAACRAAEPSP